MTGEHLTPIEAVQHCQAIFAHAWMVRTFVKHSPEAEEFTELMQVARVVFDVSRSLESRVEDPPAYFRQLRKKIGSLREAAKQFRVDAPLASDHTNFRQAVISMDACVTEWEQILRTIPSDSPTVPPKVRLPLRALDDGSSATDDKTA
ncbi:MAG: amidohydrolase [Planctomycetaceae bacterium]|nr:amidohydrolase [Planctomycetaceae bacterium]